MTAQQEAQARFKLATLWRLKGKPELAIRALQAALELDPLLLPAWLELISLQPEMRKDALRLHPDEPAFQPAPLAAPEPVLARGQDRPEHILFYCDCPGLYGAGEIQHALLVDLHARGFRLTCVQRPLPDARIEQRAAAGIEHRFLESDDLYDRSRTPLAFTDGSAAQALLEEEAPDLVVFNDGAPFSSLAAKEAAIRLGLPLMMIVHAVDSGWARQYQRYLDRLAAVYRQAAAVVAVSTENLTLLRGQFGLPAQSGEVVCNGRPQRFFAPPVTATRAKLRAQLGVAEGQCLALTVAAMEKRKGYQYQLAALRLLRERNQLETLQMAWVGAGSWERQLRLGALPYPVQFLGERHDVADLLDASDLFVLPSEFEGMPLVVLEAMARGRPVLASAVSGIPEALGTTGQLLPDPRQRPTEIASALADTLTRWAFDGELRARLGQAGRLRAEECFRQERMTAAYARIVEGILGGGP